MAKPPHTARATHIIQSPTGLDFSKIGVTRFDLSDPYHLALTARWPTFIAAVLCFYGLITSIFAILYLALPGSISNARPGAFADALFFSIETLATVGYGEMAPADLYGHLVSSAEIVCGMAFTAIMTGLLFVRFSKPKARIIYAENAVITRHNGVPTLMLRIGNGRATLLADVKVGLNALVKETSREGHGIRRVQELHLVRAAMPLFPLTLILMHVIDEHSPLAAFDHESLMASDIRLLLTVEARDPGLGAIVYDLKSYAPADILPGMHFVDTISQDDDGHIVGDLTRISLIAPDEGEGEAALQP